MCACVHACVRACERTKQRRDLILSTAVIIIIIKGHAFLRACRQSTAVEKENRDQLSVLWNRCSGLQRNHTNKRPLTMALALAYSVLRINNATLA